MSTSPLRRPDGTRPLLVASLVAVAIALLPTWYLFVRAADLGVAGVLAEFATARVAGLAATSLLLMVVVAAASVLIAVPLAFLVTRTDLPLRRTVAVLAALPLAVPSYVAAFAWLAAGELVGLRLEGFAPAALVLTLYTFPYCYLAVVGVLARTDPAQEEVARSLGYGPWRTFRLVTLAQVTPAIGGGTLLVALYTLSDFGAVSILRLDTFTRAIFTALQVGFDRTGAVALSLGLLALTALILTATHLTGRRAARYGTQEGRTPRPQPVIALGVWRVPALLACLAVIGTALGVPALTLTRWTMAGVSRPGAPSEIAQAAANTLGVGLAGAAVAVVLALPIGVLLARHRTGLPRLLERLTYLAHALPGVVVGLSLVSFGIAWAPAIYQRTPLLLLAYATLFLPLALAPITAAATRAAPVLGHVAQSLGVPPARAWWRITVPLVLPGMGAGAALVVLTIMKELPATLLLRPTGMETLATRLWSHTEVSAYAALLVALAAVPTSVLVMRAGILGGGQTSARSTVENVEGPEPLVDTLGGHR
ncbi:MAG: iron ABC transporter permease [Mobilicoccus sp.]|nr:iron ABC transporter permease [Mobilicoccus sp.]